jgi:threonine aldolase
MINLKNDYNLLAHNQILEAMLTYNQNAYVGYGLDEISQKAQEEIKKHIQKDVDIHFLVGGTSANKVVIAHALRPYEAVIGVSTGHISTHETGAIEQTGHKIYVVEGENGKMLPQKIEEAVRLHVDEHMVLPKMVYITLSTETGTIYTKKELIEIYNVCQTYGLYLYVDGARLAVGLDKSDVTLNDLATYTDVFYIGGTKNGALLGEAVVICNDSLKPNFRFSIKQNGGMYSKGFVAGIQFYELFKDDLYFKLGHHSNRMAEELSKGLLSRGIKLAYPNVTNQLFLEVSEELCKQLAKHVLFELWEDYGKRKVIRLVTNFNTSKEDVEGFFSVLDKLL